MSKPSRLQRIQRRHWEHLGQISRAAGLCWYIRSVNQHGTVLTTFEREQLKVAMDILRGVQHSMLRRGLFIQNK